MKLKFICCVIVLLISTYSFGESTKIYYKFSFDNKNINSDQQKDWILKDTLSMCECLSYGFNREECINIFTEIAMEKSRKINDIAIVQWTDGYCNEE